MVTPYHVVLSLESLGVSANSVISEIAAVRIANGVIEQDAYHQHPSIKSCEQYGLTTHGEYAFALLNCPEEARMYKVEKRYHPDLKTALQLLSTWVKYPIDNTTFWVWSSNYKLAVLANAYESCLLANCWYNGNVQELRTLKLITDTENMGVVYEPPSVRINELSEVMAQACFLLQWLERINK